MRSPPETWHQLNSSLLKDATPLRQVKLNKVPFVPNNEPLLGILDKFQEGRSHMAIVSRFSVEKAKSFKKAVKHGLTQRIRQTVGISDDSSSSSSSSELEDSGDDGISTGTGVSERKPHNPTVLDGQVDQDATPRENAVPENDQDGGSGGGGNPEAGFSKRRFRLRRKKDKKRHRKARREKTNHDDIESGDVPQDTNKIGGFGLSSKEQIISADAVLPEENANEVHFASPTPTTESLRTAYSFSKYLILRSCRWESSLLKMSWKVRILRFLVSTVTEIR